MDDMFFKRVNQIFLDLFNLSIEECNLRKVRCEPSTIIEKIISPSQSLFLKNLAELLDSLFPEKR